MLEKIHLFPLRQNSSMAKHSTGKRGRTSQQGWLRRKGPTTNLCTFFPSLGRDVPFRRDFDGLFGPDEKPAFSRGICNSAHSKPVWSGKLWQAAHVLGRHSWPKGFSWRIQAGSSYTAAEATKQMESAPIMTTPMFVSSSQTGGMKNPNRCQKGYLQRMLFVPSDWERGIFLKQKV